jgi:apolipoprotein N-acyltransferase
LLALSFPRFGHPACAWIALVPLLVALSGWSGRPGVVRGQTAMRSFMLGLTTGTSYFVGTIYWTGSVLVQFGNLHVVIASLGMLLLAAYLAIYPAVTAVVVSRLIARLGVRALFFAPFAWVATEFARGHVFGGFPWVPLGNSQVTVLPVAQLASVLGVYGLSALVAYVNATVAFALLTTGRPRINALAAAALVVMGIGAWGTWRVADGSLTRQGEPIQVGLIQGNIAQEDKWKPSEARRIFTTYVAMTRDAVRRGAEYVIWPESSTPFSFEDPNDNPAADAMVRELARETRVPMLFGSDQVIRSATPELYNAAFLITPEGRTAAVYRKVHLVPFGEFFPLQRWITFVAPLVERFAPFSAGDGPVMLPVGSHRASTAICYEVVFPELTRAAVLAGSELLTTVTNDGWYGYSSAPYQHFELASMRAIEHGRYLARAANTGISGVVDPYGRLVAKSGIFEQVTVIAQARFLTNRTIYAQIGDAIAYASIVLTVAAMVALRVRRV